MQRLRALRFLAVLALVALVAVACGDDDGGSATDDDGADTGDATLGIDDPWSRAPADGQQATAVYGVVSNPGDTDVQLESASSPVTDVVELHITTMDDDGVMSMQEVPEGFTVPAGGTFVFEPGGPHIMLLDIDPATYPDEVEITLEADNGESLTFTAEVRTVEGGMDMDHDDMDDMEMDDMEMEDEG